MSSGRSRTRAVAVLAAFLAAPGVAPVARAGGAPESAIVITNPEGPHCRLHSEADPDPGSGPRDMAGTLSGEVTWDRPVTLHCLIRINANLHSSTANEVVHEQAGSQPTLTGHVATMAPRSVAYNAPEASQVYVCASVTYGSPETTRYYRAADEGPDGIRGTPDDQPGGWTADPDTPCMAALHFDSGPLG